MICFRYNKLWIFFVCKGVAIISEIDRDAYDFGERLVNLRKRRGLTQKQVSKLLGISATAYGRYEKNLQSPGVETLKNIARIFHTTPDFLLGFSDSEVIVIENLANYQKDIINYAINKFRQKN